MSTEEIRARQARKIYGVKFLNMIDNPLIGVSYSSIGELNELKNNLVQREYLLNKEIGYDVLVQLIPEISRCLYKMPCNILYLFTRFTDETGYIKIQTPTLADHLVDILDKYEFITVISPDNSFGLMINLEEPESDLRVWGNAWSNYLHGVPEVG